ncbi:hypothetical protein V1291_001247 [Nitrobacteraceae bacterium AZCC 1564]
MTNRILFAACASVMLMTSATAQSPLFPEGRSRQDGSVRVQSSLNFFVPGPTGDSEEAQKLREKARRMIYETAARECDLLKDTLAKDCRLENVNSNINTNRQYGPAPQDGFTINGSMSFQITLK